MSSAMRWALLGLLGLLVAGAVAFLAIRAVSEKIGISSESPAAGKALAPRADAPSPKKPSRDQGDSGAPAPTTGVPQPAPAPAPGGGTADDYAARGGNGEGGDD